jgi:hypothetical protein
MLWHSHKRIIFILLFISICVNYNGIAQNSSFQIWPEADIWYTIDPSWRLSAFIPMTKYYDSKYRELNIYLQAEYKWGRLKYAIYRKLIDENKAQLMKAWMLRGGVMKGWGIGANSDNYHESMIFAEIHRRHPLIGNVMVSQRFRTDLRWLDPDAEFSYRFRYRGLIEKEFKTDEYSIVPYFHAEVSWDSRYDTFNRLRLVAGSTVSWEPSFMLEGNFTYQYDSKSSINNVYALNVILHLFFE